MTLEARIESSGRRILTSPLWVGLLITAFLVIPTFLVPSVPLWVAISSLVTLLPLVLATTYSIYYLYGKIRSRTQQEAVTYDDEAVSPALEQLRHQYAVGEIDETTFERNVERLLETEPDQRSHHYLRSNSELLEER